MTTYEVFARTAAREPLVSVTRTVFADADTPVSVYRKLGAERPGTFLLESAEQGHFARYSFVGAGVFGVLSERNGFAHWIPERVAGADLLTEARLLDGGVSTLQPLDALRRITQQWETSDTSELPPLVGGFVGYLGWETVAELERIEFSGDAPSVPRQHLGFVADLVVVDHHTGSLTLVANVLTDRIDASARGDDPAVTALWDNAQQRIDAMARALAAPSPSPLGTVDRSSEANPTRFTSADEFHEMVEAAKVRIADGDIFQVVLAQRFDQPCTASPLDVYRVLRHLNPSPYLYLLSCSDEDGAPVHVVGSSPEALITVHNGHVLTHPIAGSRPRGATTVDDQLLETELLADPKERSEHLMLVDLSRNDLSRVCAPGSVEVTEFMRIERFSHIMHIGSTVEGDLREGLSPVDALAAAFPAGTLSGAPKPWALRIIDELEPVRRGVYGGVVGYVGFSGHADLAIAIRSATLQNGIATVQAGGGIVADSVPELEEAESRNKAAAPLRAVAIANSLSPTLTMTADTSGARS